MAHTSVLPLDASLHHRTRRHHRPRACRRCPELDTAVTAACLSSPSMAELLTTEIPRGTRHGTATVWPAQARCSGTNSTPAPIPSTSSSSTFHRYRFDALPATVMRFPPLCYSSRRATAGEEKIGGGERIQRNALPLCPMPVLRCTLCMLLDRKQWPARV
jgi:hypothetical protein